MSDFSVCYYLSDIEKIHKHKTNINMGQFKNLHKLADKNLHKYHLK